MLKHTLYSLLSATLFLGVLSTSYLGNTASAEQEAKPKKNQPTEVQAVIKKLDYLKTRANVKADYYVLLNSASWCGPCHREMPHVVEAYKEMKRTRKVELILLSGDKTEEAALAFLKQYKGKFPVVLGVPTIPGHVKSGGVPNATIIDKDGNTLANGHGSIVMDWKKYTIDAEKAKEEK